MLKRALIKLTQKFGNKFWLLKAMAQAVDFAVKLWTVSVFETAKFICTL